MHLPIQSGSDRILRKMKRKVSVAEIMHRVEKLRKHGDDFAISTDIIVGFPGETEEDFAATLQIVRDINFSFIYAFKYSPRPHTPAARYTEQLAEEVKSERLARLLSLQKEITLAQNKQEISKTREVLVHYRSKKEPSVYYGRTQHFRLVRIPSAHDIVGEMLSVKIKSANATALSL